MSVKFVAILFDDLHIFNFEKFSVSRHEQHGRLRRQQHDVEPAPVQQRKPDGSGSTAAQCHGRSGRDERLETTTNGRHAAAAATTATTTAAATTSRTATATSTRSNGPVPGSASGQSQCPDAVHAAATTTPTAAAELHAQREQHAAGWYSGRNKEPRQPATNEFFVPAGVAHYATAATTNDAFPKHGHDHDDATAEDDEHQYANGNAHENAAAAAATTAAAAATAVAAVQSDAAAAAAAAATTATTTVQSDAAAVQPGAAATTVQFRTATTVRTGAAFQRESAVWPKSAVRTGAAVYATIAVHGSTTTTTTAHHATTVDGPATTAAASTTDTAAGGVFQLAISTGRQQQFDE